MLNAIRDMTQRLTIGNQCLASAGLAASGANALTANAVTLTIDGLFVAFAAEASIVLGTLPAFNHEGKSASKATTVPVGFTVKYVLAANAAGNMALLCGAPMDNAGIDPADWPPLPEGYAPFGGIKVINAGAAAFTPGTTAFATAGVTATFLNFMTIPPRSV